MQRFTYSQMLRHNPTYFSPSMLDTWGIKYSIIHQQQFEVFVTFPNTAHQGFSYGKTDAEAINYTDST